jgi:hypothetical protein
MATTTNYGWTTPNDTDLVKDGAAAIRTLGSSVDTTTKALNPSTTLGDIEYRSATANTNTRLPLGTAGQVLTVNSGANAPEWATASSGGMTLISTTTLSGSTLNLTSIPQTYNHLQLKIVNFQPSVDGNEMTMRPNNNTGTVYRPITALSAEAALGAADRNLIKVNSYNDDTVAQGMSIVDIYNYTDTSTYKLIEIKSIGNDNGTPANLSYIFTVVAFYSTSAITSLTLFVPSGNFTSGTALLYGVK